MSLGANVLSSSENTHLIKKEGKIYPYTQDDKEVLDGIENGVVFTAKITYPRNPKHHRLAMAAVSLTRDTVAPTKKTHLVLNDIKIMIGHVEFGIPIGENEEYLQVYPKSINWSSLSQPAFREFFDRMIIACAKLCNVSVEDFLAELDEMKSWGKCANPECQGKAVHVHHVFGGTARRERSEQMGLKVAICNECHWKSHGWIRAGRSWQEQDREERREQIKKWKRLWCEVLGIDFESAWEAIQGSLPAEKNIRAYKLRPAVQGAMIDSI